MPNDALRYPLISNYNYYNYNHYYYAHLLVSRQKYFLRNAHFERVGLRANNVTNQLFHLLLHIKETKID